MALNKDLDSYERGFGPFFKEGLSETFKNLRFRQQHAPHAASPNVRKTLNTIGTIQTMSMIGLAGMMLGTGYDFYETLQVYDQVDETKIEAVEDITASGGIVAGNNLIALEQDGDYFVFSNSENETSYVLVENADTAEQLIRAELSTLERYLTISEIEAQHGLDLSDNDTALSITYEHINPPYQYVYENGESESIQIGVSGHTVSGAPMDAEALTKLSADWQQVLDRIDDSDYSSTSIAHTDYVRPEMGSWEMIANAYQSLGLFAAFSAALGFGIAGARHTGLAQRPRPIPTHKRKRSKDSAYVGKSSNTDHPGPL
jgi:hypothetical protein